jgi:hypothetical protein
MSEKKENDTSKPVDNEPVLRFLRKVSIEINSLILYMWDADMIKDHVRHEMMDASDYLFGISQDLIKYKNKIQFPDPIVMFLMRYPEIKWEYKNERTNNDRNNDTNNDRDDTETEAAIDHIGDEQDG